MTELKIENGKIKNIKKSQVLALKDKFQSHSKRKRA